MDVGVSLFAGFKMRIRKILERKLFDFLKLLRSLQHQFVGAYR